MQGEYEFSFTDQPMTNAEFLKYMEIIGSFSPLQMSPDQLKTLLSVLIRNYGGDEDFDMLALDAATMALEAEAIHQLNMAVGPEDGVH